MSEDLHGALRGGSEAVAAHLCHTPRMAAADFQEPRDEHGHLIRELHGVTLAMVLEKLVATYGWSTLAEYIPLNCFASNPSIASSLKFLRRTPWARKKVEALYIDVREAEVLGRPLP